MFERFLDIMHRGGPVMWLLLAMSMFGLTLVFERAWFWLRTNSPQRLARVQRMSELLRAGDVAAVRVLAEDDASIYGRVLAPLLREGYSEAAATAAVEAQRHRMERSMTMLSTLITGGPLVGLFGTVVGLIATFRLLSDEAVNSDSRAVTLGLSEALLNTGAGLFVAIVVLFPYSAFRVQIERTLGRIEALLAAVSHAATAAPPAAPGACT